jgi:hypothetical protein
MSALFVAKSLYQTLKEAKKLIVFGLALIVIGDHKMATHRGLRDAANWRYRTIKGYKQRAETFYQKSNSEAEGRAWLEVIKWFNSILKENRCITVHGAIGLSEEPIIQNIGEVSEHGQRSST